MPSDKQNQSLSEIWSERYDDRDDEELACHIWAQQLAARDHAMANPIKAFDLPDENAPGRDRPTADENAPGRDRPTADENAPGRDRPAAANDPKPA